MDLRLRGKTGLVTGASKGIGRAVAEGFAAEGCHLTLVARSAEALRAAAEAIAARHGVRVEAVPADLSRTEACERLATAHGGCDVLVNNAGAIPGGKLDDVPADTFKAAWDLKVFGYVALTRAVFARMRERRAGVIVNVIGLAGVMPMYDYICGTGGNAALHAITRAVGSRAPDWGVRVLGVNPPMVATERMEAVMRGMAKARHGDPERWRELLADRPFGRPAEPAEVADLVVFLASARAGYMSGTVVDMDGGVVSRR